MLLAVLVSGVLTLTGGLSTGGTGARGETAAARIDLSLPHSQSMHYWNEMLPVRIRLTNTSSRNEIYVGGCDQENPEVQAVSVRGTVVFPPALPLLRPIRCPETGLAAFLGPGRTVHLSSLVVLRAERVRARSTSGGSSTVFLASMLHQALPLSVVLQLY
jgi:hypothetical protein